MDLDLKEFDLQEFGRRFESVRERGMPFEMPEIREWFAGMLVIRRSRWDKPRLDTVVDAITKLLDLQCNRSRKILSTEDVAKLAADAIALALKYPPLATAGERFARRQVKRKAKVGAWSDARDAASRGEWLRGGEGSDDAG